MKSIQLSIPVPWDESLDSLLNNPHFLAIVAMPLVLGVVAFIYSRIVGPSVPDLHVEYGELESSDTLDVEKYTKAMDKKAREEKARFI